MNVNAKVGLSYYLNVGKNEPRIKQAYLEQTRRLAAEVNAAGRPFFLELKHLDLVNPEAIAELKPMADMFTMHLQYLNRPGKEDTTLNLADLKDRYAIAKDGQVKEAFRLMDPALVSVHCGFSTEDIGVAPPDNSNYAKSPVLSAELVRSRIDKTVVIASEYFGTLGHKSPLLIENLDYHPAIQGLGFGGAYEHVCEPGFILSVLGSNSRTAMLLDIAHSIISSNALGFDPVKFATALFETNKLKQLHLNAPLRQGCNMLDMHLPFYTDSEVVAILKKVLSLHHAERPLFVTIEPSVGQCEKDPEEAVYRTGMELIDIVESL